MLLIASILALFFATTPVTEFPSNLLNQLGPTATSVGSKILGQSDDGVLESLPNEAGRKANMQHKARYPSLTATLVIACQKGDEIDWLEEVGDLYDIKRYVVDDPTAEYTVTSKNGMESMVYLTYIIDHYDQLADTTTFHHFHDHSYMHTPIPGMTARTYLRQIQHHNVLHSIGYRNVQCKDDWGCRPDFGQKPELGTFWENRFLVEAWLELWPDDPVPKHLATPCCTQFVASRPAIRSRTKEEYVRYREWLYNLPNQQSILNIDRKWFEPDYDAGIAKRAGFFFEYVWQWILLREPVVCPSPLDCSCSMFGACFDTMDQYDAYRGMSDTLKEKQLKVEALEEFFHRDREARREQMEHSDEADSVKDWLREESQAFERRAQETLFAEILSINKFETRMNRLGGLDV